MRSRSSATLFAVILASLGAGCACKPTAPLPAKEPGTVHFTISGSAKSITIFEEQLRANPPHDCQSKATDQAIAARNERPMNARTVFLCRNVDEKTFAAFGSAFVQTLGRADELVGLRLAAGTTPCDWTQCPLSSEWDWFLPDRVCAYCP